MAQACSLRCEEEVRRLIEAKPDAIGIALILANDYNCSNAAMKGYVPLEGPLKDAQVAENVFSSLGTVCYTKLNASAGITMEACKAVASYVYQSPMKWIVVIFSGHGESNEEIVGQNGERIKVQKIIDYYDPISISYNARIPKVLLFDACRGKEVTEAVLVSRGEHSTLHGGHQTPRGGTLCDSFRMPARGNMLIAYSTQPNTKAFECKGSGGLWLSTLLERIRVDDLSISDILNNVHEDVVHKYKDKDLMQLPEHKSTLMGGVHFLREAKTICQGDFTHEKATVCQEYSTHEKATICQEDIPQGSTQKLNRLWKEKLIQDKKYTDQEDSHVTLTIMLDNSTEVEFNSKTYCLQFRCINDARECVAYHAIELIEQQKPSQPAKPDTTNSSLFPEDFYSRSNGPSANSGDPAPVKLKNHIHDQLKHDAPLEYSCEENKPLSGPSKYRFTVKHPLFKDNATGSWCKNKKDAKISAATKALITMNLL